MLEPVNPNGEVCALLPPEARQRLAQAARVEGELARRIAVDEAIDHVRLRFPSFFHHPQPE